jgi:hypothetical protein
MRVCARQAAVPWRAGLSQKDAQQFVFVWISPAPGGKKSQSPLQHRQAVRHGSERERRFDPGDFVGAQRQVAGAGIVGGMRRA